jgi:DNA-directed RNA polymerase specialized sigma24 family protein
LGRGAGRPATDPMEELAGGSGGSPDARRPSSCAAEDRESWYCPLLWKRICAASGIRPRRCSSRLDLEKAVAALGPPGGADRETWQLLCVEDRSVAEVAALMGVPEGTVKSRAHRARRTLREALGDRLAVEGGS